jgi:hypothetical protein
LESSLKFTTSFSENSVAPLSWRSITVAFPMSAVLNTPDIVAALREGNAL